MPRVSTALDLPLHMMISLDSWQMTMLTIIFLHVHIIYCRSLQLRMRWRLQVTLRLGGSCMF